MLKVVRMLRWYEKTPIDALAGEAPMPHARLQELQPLFGVPSSNPMYDCWLVARRRQPRCRVWPVSP